MFDFDEEYKTTVSLTYRSYDADGNIEASVERILRGEDAEYLPAILNAFRNFLQGMTFTYVDNVVVTTEGGREHSADDLL